MIQKMNGGFLRQIRLTLFLFRKEKVTEFDFKYCWITKGTCYHLGCFEVLQCQGFILLYIDWIEMYVVIWSMSIYREFWNIDVCRLKSCENRV